MKLFFQLAIGMLVLFGTHNANAAPEFLNSGKILKGDFPLSEAVKVNGTLYLSGQLGISPLTQKLVEGGIEAESKQAMDNIQTILETNGYTMNDVVKCTAFLIDMKEWPAFNTVYRERFKVGKYPARSALAVSALAMKAKVEVECIAAK